MDTPLDKTGRALAATDLPSASSELWRRLGSEGWEGRGITLSPAESNAIRRKIDGAIEIAEAEMVGAEEVDFVVAMGLIGSMPSQKIGEVLANAVMEAYRIAVLDLPADLLIEAAHRAVRDTKNEKGYRPPPPVLRKYVEAEFDERVRRLRRLKAIAATSAPRQPGPVFDPPQIAENFVDRDGLIADTFAKIDAGIARMTGVSAEPPRKADPPGSGFRSARMQELADRVRAEREGPVDDGYGDLDDHPFPDRTFA